MQNALTDRIDPLSLLYDLLILIMLADNFACKPIAPMKLQSSLRLLLRIIIGSDRRPETKQAIEGKIDRFRSGRVGVKVRC